MLPRLHLGHFSLNKPVMIEGVLGMKYQNEMKDSYK
jgi:hypothetical protein